MGSRVTKPVTEADKQIKTIKQELAKLDENKGYKIIDLFSRWLFLEKHGTEKPYPANFSPNVFELYEFLKPTGLVKNLENPYHLAVHIGKLHKTRKVTAIKAFIQPWVDNPPAGLVYGSEVALLPKYPKQQNNKELITFSEDHKGESLVELNDFDNSFDVSWAYRVIQNSIMVEEETSKKEFAKRRITPILARMVFEIFCCIKLEYKDGQEHEAAISLERAAQWAYDGTEESFIKHKEKVRKMLLRIAEVANIDTSAGVMPLMRVGRFFPNEKFDTDNFWIKFQLPKTKNDKSIKMNMKALRSTYTTSIRDTRAYIAVSEIMDKSAYKGNPKPKYRVTKGKLVESKNNKYVGKTSLIDICERMGYDMKEGNKSTIRSYKKRVRDTLRDFDKANLIHLERVNDKESRGVEMYRIYAPRSKDVLELLQLEQDSCDD